MKARSVLKEKQNAQIESLAFTPKIWLSADVWGAVFPYEKGIICRLHQSGVLRSGKFYYFL